MRLPLRPAVLLMWVLALFVVVLGAAQQSGAVLALGTLMCGIAGWRTRVALTSREKR